jgi:ribonuclease Y
MHPIVIGVVALLLGAAIGWWINQLRQQAAARQAGDVLTQARRDAEGIVRDAKVAAAEQATQTRAAAEEEAKTRRQEVAEVERRVVQREGNLDRKADLLDRKGEEIVRKELTLIEREKQVQKLQDELDDLKRLSRKELERVAGMGSQQARTMLLQQVENEVSADAAVTTRRIMDQARDNAEREARRVIGLAMERCASHHVHSATTCTLTLPSEDMKGRIIGREGRNIRAFEAATGINVLIDDTPQTVVLSGFDPVRREIARVTLERLIADGRINPARIEEETHRVEREIDETIRHAGEDAINRAGVLGVHPEIVKTLGRLRFRHSFSQNVLEHSIEVAHLAGMIAAELGWDQTIAKRSALFHDIGKAVDSEVEGTHAAIGAQLLRRFGESADVCDAVASHHHEVEPVTAYGTLASVADAISASRPGARSESMDLYLQRLQKLEEIAATFAGVEKCFALQAGREIRVIVQPDKLNDNDAVLLARQISKKIERELQYPGQIKVTVVRETRTVEFAK